MKNRVQTSLIVTAAWLLLAASCGQRQSQTAGEGNASLKFSKAEERNEISPETLLLQRIYSQDIPGDAGYIGDLSEAYRYMDKTGENIVILTETEVTTTEDEDGNIVSYKAIYAYRFLKKNNKWEEAWRVLHYEDECINYPVAEFVKEAFAITDLDKNGVAETWLVFISSCHGDISPDKLFIRMDDGEAVYKMTGERRLKFSDDYIIGGSYAFDEKFTDSLTPQAFKEYAVKLWEKQVDRHH